MVISKELNNILKNDVVWFTNKADCLFLTKFHSSYLSVFYIESKWYVLTDDRYFNAAKDQIKNMIILNVKDKPIEEIIIPEIKKTGKDLIVDSNFVPFSQYLVLKEKFEIKEGIKVKPISYDGIRMIKSQKDIKNTQIACSITDEIFKQIIPFIKVGTTEKKIKKELLKLIIDSKAEDKSFSPIIAAGKNGAIPHWEASDYKLKTGDMVTLDFGVKYNNMVSDMTRTIAVAKLPSEEEQKIHQIVLEALNETIKIIKPGLKCKYIDEFARNYIKIKGYEKYFIHSLGHGIGIEIHESPNFSPSDETKLEEGMLLTVEPGIYIENKYGVRIEQDIVVTKNKVLELNKSNKKLMVIQND